MSTLTPAELRPKKPISELSRHEAEQLLAQLAQIIIYHDRLYHDADDIVQPEISDSDYDALIALNRETEVAFPNLVRSDSPSRRVGSGTGIAASANSVFLQNHTQPAMLSLGMHFMPMMSPTLLIN